MDRDKFKAILERAIEIEGFAKVEQEIRDLRERISREKSAGKCQGGSGVDGQSCQESLETV